MNDKPVLFSVTIEGLRATLKRIEPGKRGYATASKKVIYRERDAIALYNDRTSEGAPLDGVYSFQSIDNAKTLAFLHLKSLQRVIAGNMDRVQVYDGSKASSG